MRESRREESNEPCEDMIETDGDSPHIRCICGLEVGHTGKHECLCGHHWITSYRARDVVSRWLRYTGRDA